MKARGLETVWGLVVLETLAFPTLVLAQPDFAPIYMAQAAQCTFDTPTGGALTPVGALATRLTTNYSGGVAGSTTVTCTTSSTLTLGDPTPDGANPSLTKAFAQLTVGSPSNAQAYSPNHPAGATSVTLLPSSQPQAITIDMTADALTGLLRPGTYSYSVVLTLTSP